jgi:hypothetical protein
MNDSVGLAYVLFLVVIPLIGVFVITIGEIFLLKKQGWVDEKQSIIYPVVTNIINLVIGAGLIMFNVFISIFSNYTFLNLLMSITNTDEMTPTLFIISFGLTAILLFILDLVILVSVRLLITRLLVKSSTLTWKYIIVFASLPAFLFAVGYPLFGMISAVLE